MNLLIFNKEKPTCHENLLPRIFRSGGMTSALVRNGLLHSSRAGNHHNHCALVLPNEWEIAAVNNGNSVNCISSHDSCIDQKHINIENRERWLTLSQGRYVLSVDFSWLYDILNSLRADVVFVMVEPDLMPFRDKVTLTSEGDIAGIRRFYDKVVWPVAINPDQPPHYIFIKENVLPKLVNEGLFCLDYTAIIRRCKEQSLAWRGIQAAGTVLDLETETGLLTFLSEVLALSGKYVRQDGSDLVIEENARMVGTVFMGKNVHIERNAIVVGPAILEDNVTVGADTLVHNAIVGKNVKVPEKSRVDNDIVLGLGYNDSVPVPANRSIKGRERFSIHKGFSPQTYSFRHWPRYSYVTTFKRIVDIVAALGVLVLVAPIFPIVALIVKLTSKGPVFFRDRRQGLHGNEFYCIKFRTMMAGADKIQDRLRARNQVDGPQFKMEDDPRVNAVGKFLRETCIDEIPQFINVLLGEMSVVGPRPSPEKENSLCAYWRDARLSVRPGITGLWQVCRTREEGQDFQEWVCYDTRYIKNLSLALDFWICCKTVKQLLKSFVKQF